MKTINLICLTVCVVLATANPLLEPRIANGEDAKEGQFPYQVSIRSNIFKEHFCGGSILNSRFILSAAHCNMGAEGLPKNIYAVVGALRRTQGGIVVEVDKITMHEEFDLHQMINDISLLRTAKDIIFSDTVQPIALPKQNIPDDRNTNVIISGWGKQQYPSRTFPDILQYTEPHTISKEECVKRLEPAGMAQYVRDIVICTSNKESTGVCHGDSGGPLVDITDPENKTLVGVAVWTIPCGKGYPDVHTRVYSYLDWIQKHIEEQSTNLE